MNLCCGKRLGMTKDCATCQYYLKQIAYPKELAIRALRRGKEVVDKVKDRRRNGAQGDENRSEQRDHSLRSTEDHHPGPDSTFGGGDTDAS
jgi:hypothetical protein